MRLSKRAFTLVELIIVIAVIGVLAAILIPVFSNVIKKANAKSALADARNAVSMYVTESLDKRVHGDTSSPENITIIVEKGGRYYAFGYNTAESSSILVSNANEDGMSASDLDALINDHSFNVQNGGTYDPDTTYTLSDGAFYLVPYTGTTPDNANVRGFVSAESASGNFLRLDEEAAGYGFDLNVGDTTAVFHGCLVKGTYDTVSATTNAPAPTATPSPTPAVVTTTVTINAGNLPASEYSAFKAKYGSQEIAFDGTGNATFTDVPETALVASFSIIKTGTSDYASYNFDYSTGTVADHSTLTASWTAPTYYSLTFNKGEGSALELAEAYKPAGWTNNGDTLLSGTYIADFVKHSRATAPTGKTFLGWTLNGGETVYNEGSSTIPFTANSVFTAEFGTQQVTVTYKSGDHSNGADIEETVSYGEHSLKAFASTSWSVDTGYDFYRWSIGGVEYAESANYSFTSNTTITAIYSQQKFTVEYQGSTGVTVPSGSTQYNVGTSSVTITGVTVGSNYYLTGYAVAGLTGTTTLPANTTSLNTSAAVSGNNIIITPQVSPKTVAVTFTAPAGATGVPASGTRNFATDGNTINLGTPTLEHHNTPVYTVTATDNASGTISGTTLTLSTSSTGSITVTLTFTADPTYNVTYNANGGSGTMTDSTTYYAGDPVTLAANTFTAPQNKQFVGWKVNNAGETLAAGATFAISANTQVYAQWEDTASTPSGDLVISVRFVDVTSMTTTPSSGKQAYLRDMWSTNGVGQRDLYQSEIDTYAETLTTFIASAGYLVQYNDITTVFPNYPNLGNDSVQYGFAKYATNWTKVISEAASVSFGGADMLEGNIYYLPVRVVSRSANMRGISSSFYNARTEEQRDVTPTPIYNQTDLIGIGSSMSTMGGHYILMNDITLSFTSGTTWNPLGFGLDDGDDVPFMGSFDGNGKTIYGLESAYGNPIIDPNTQETSYNENVGLFSIVGSVGTISNLTIRTTSNGVVGGYKTGVIAGQNYGIITNVTVTGPVISESPLTVGYASVVATGPVDQNTQSNAGGMIGVNEGIITGCTANIEVSGYSCVGGIAGVNNGGTITGTTANIAGINTAFTDAQIATNENDTIGGIVGYNGGTVSGCAAIYDTGAVIKGFDTVGGAVGLNEGTITDTHATDVDMIAFGHGGGLVGINAGIITATAPVAPATTYATYATVKQINGELTDEAIEEYEVTCIGGFVGLNNGTEDTVAGRASITNAYASILPLSSTQMGIVGGYQCVGGFAGGNAAYGTITNCYANDVNLYGIRNVGGFVGENASEVPEGVTTRYYGIITNCHLSLYGINNILGDTELTANPVLSIGGFAGLNDAQINTSYVDFNTDAMVTGRQYVGGFVGYNDEHGTIAGIGSVVNNDVVITTPCDASDVILYGYWYVGGFAGQNDGSIVYSTAEVIDIDGYMSTSTMSTKIVNYVGGFCGYNEKTINYCDVTFDGDASGIYGINNVGGFVGYNTYNGDVNLCTATNPFIYAYNYVGGFAGQNEGSALTTQGSITNCTVYLNGINSTMSDSNVANTSFVGGFVGLNDAVMSNCAVLLAPDTSSHIIMGYAKVGGFFGRNTERGNITTSDCKGSYIYGIQLVGGFGGENYGAVSESYASIYAINYNVSASDLSSMAVSFVGGLIGANRGTVANCYTLVAGSVRGANYVGGLMGANYQGGQAINCFSDATPYGTNSSAFSISYRDNTQTMSGIFFVATSGSSAGATRVSRNTIKSTSFETLATSAGWSTSVWTFQNGSYPRLSNNMPV